MRRLRTHALGVSADDVAFSRRGFHQASAEVVRTLERAGQSFVRGYMGALEHPGAGAGQPAGQAEAGQVGFVHEGAGMALALLDGLAPWPRRRGRLAEFLESADEHVYMIHIGAGWALARLPRLAWPRVVRQLDPVLRWLALDGYGFHGCYFGRVEDRVGRHAPDRRLAASQAAFPEPHASRSLDTGIGRALWFVHGGDVNRVATAVTGYAAHRWPDLWSGVGLAATYVGGAGASDLRRLRVAAGPLLPCAAQGAAFAAKARQRASNPVPHTELATRELCGTGAREAAALVDAAWRRVSQRPAGTAFLAWREEVTARLRAGARTRSTTPGDGRGVATEPRMIEEHG